MSLSVDQIIKLHEAGFDSEFITSLNTGEPKQEPKREPKQEPKQEPKPDINYSELLTKIDSLSQMVQGAMIRSTEQPKAQSVDDILTSILTPSGGKL